MLFTPGETRRVEMIAMQAVMAVERELGFVPRDVSADKCGYDIESHDPTGEARLRFIEVKGRVQELIPSRSPRTRF